MAAPPASTNRRHKLSYTVKPGGLSPEDHERIFSLAEKGLTCGRIAHKLEKHPATVRWFMYRNGLARPSTKHGMPKGRPNAAGRKAYSPEEDAFIVALRAAGTDLRIIAEQVSERFGHKRSRHGVEVRLVMLAAAGDEPAEAA